MGESKNTGNNIWQIKPKWQITINDFLENIHNRETKVISFLKNLNMYASNSVYEIANIESWEDWKVKKIHIKNKNDKKWELLEIVITKYEYSLDPNSSYNTDDESLVARLKWEIMFETKIKGIEGYIKEILKQFHEINRK